MLKQITLVDAVKRVINGHRVFMMMEIDPHTTIEDLSFSDGFIVIEEEDPQPEAKLENIKIHDLLEGDDDSNEQTNSCDNTDKQDG